MRMVSRVSRIRAFILRLFRAGTAFIFLFTCPPRSEHDTSVCVLRTPRNTMPLGRASTYSTTARNVDCGPACLYIAFRLCDASVDYDQILRECRTLTHGASLQSLKCFASNHGMPCHGLRLRSGDVSSIPVNLVAILYVFPGLYVVAFRTHGRYLRICDPSFGVSDVTSDEFGSRYTWKGQFLLFQLKAPTVNSHD